MVLASIHCGSEGNTSKLVGTEPRQVDAAACSPDWNPTWQQGPGANAWWVEYLIDGASVTSAQLEVVGRGTVPLTSSWGKWVGSASSAIDAGTRVVVRAQDSAGRSASTQELGYLVVTAPSTAPCAGTGTGTGTGGGGGCVAWTPSWQQGSGANNWWVEYSISDANVVSAGLEVIAGGAVPLSQSWGKWGGSSSAAIPTGANVRAHATDAQGRTALTQVFPYLVNQKPVSDSTCSPTPTPTAPPPAPPPPSPAQPPPAGTDLVFTVDTSAATTPISALIYGTNNAAAARQAGGALTFVRASGNRYSTYNWETNASNAGAFWFQQNDGELAVDSGPAAPARQAIDAALATNGTALVTVPMMGWVSADMNGPVNAGEPRDSRFHPSVANKSGALALAPDLNDGVVYQDEFVNYISVRYGGAFSGSTPQVFFCLDNEPSLWNENFSRAYFDPPRIRAVIDASITYASMIKRVQPNAIVLGPVLYGWNDFTNFQGAVDYGDLQYGGRLFVEIYLQAMRDAAGTGKRLIDALDFHWYPEARGDGIRIIASDTTPGIVQARLQAPRSLWDPTYVEDSWITHDSIGGSPIRLLPWLAEITARIYPGTRLAISEYNYGGQSHISGAIAEADVLGIFGRERVYAANLFELTNDGSPFIYAGIAMYRNFDGAGGRFGDLSVPARTTNPVTSSVYAASQSGSPGRLTLVVINKSAASQTARIDAGGSARGARAAVYVLTQDTAQPRPAGTLSADAQGTFYYTLPGMSVSTLLVTLIP